MKKLPIFFLIFGILSCSNNKNTELMPVKDVLNYIVEDVRRDTIDDKLINYDSIKLVIYDSILESIPYMINYNQEVSVNSEIIDSFQKNLNKLFISKKDIQRSKDLKTCNFIFENIRNSKINSDIFIDVSFRHRRLIRYKINKENISRYRDYFIAVDDYLVNPDSTKFNIKQISADKIKKLPTKDIYNLKNR